MGQVVLGFVVAATLLFNSNTQVYREYAGAAGDSSRVIRSELNGKQKLFIIADKPITTIPFVKGHEFDYSKLLPTAIRGVTWILYILVVIFIITAVSNGANITDGVDGLATGVSAIIGVCLGIFAYASGNIRL